MGTQNNEELTVIMWILELITEITFELICKLK